MLIAPILLRVWMGAAWLVWTTVALSVANAASATPVQTDVTATTVDLGQLDLTPFAHVQQGTVSQAIPQVIYSFSLQSACTFTCNLSSLTVNVDVYLYDGVGAQLAASEKTALNAESISKTLQPGNYTVAVQNKTSSTGTFQSSLAAVFITDEFIVSGNLDLPDPEFDSIANRTTWRTPDGNLMVAPLDPATGNFNLAAKQMLDTGLALQSVVPNGPEWALSSARVGISYTKSVAGVLSIGDARLDSNGTWTVSVLPGTTNGRSPIASLSRLTANRLVKYAVGNGAGTIVKWQDLENSSLGGTVGGASDVVQAGRWSPDQRSLFVSLLVGSVYQIARFDVDTARLTTLTTGTSQKISPFPIKAPEYGGELLLTTLDSSPAHPDYYDAIGVYRLNWQPEIGI